MDVLAVLSQSSRMGLNPYFTHRETARNNSDCSLNFRTVSNLNVLFNKSFSPPPETCNIHSKPLEKSTQVQI